VDQAGGVAIQDTLELLASLRRTSQVLARNCRLPLQRFRPPEGQLTCAGGACEDRT